MNTEAQIEREWKKIAEKKHAAITAGIVKLQLQDLGYVAEIFVQEYRYIAGHTYKSTADELIDLEWLLGQIESEIG